jgi:hypothetical protein
MVFLFPALAIFRVIFGGINNPVVFYGVFPSVYIT